MTDLTSASAKRCRARSANSAARCWCLAVAVLASRSSKNNSLQSASAPRRRSSEPSSRIALDFQQGECDRPTRPGCGRCGRRVWAVTREMAGPPRRPIQDGTYSPVRSSPRSFPHPIAAGRQAGTRRGGDAMSAENADDLLGPETQFLSDLDDLGAVLVGHGVGVRRRRVLPPAGVAEADP